MYYIEFYKINEDPKYLAEHDGDCCMPVKDWNHADFADITSNEDLDTPRRVMEFCVEAGRWMAGKRIADWLAPDGIEEGYIRVYKARKKITTHQPRAGRANPAAFTMTKEELKKDLSAAIQNWRDGGSAVIDMPNGKTIDEEDMLAYLNGAGWDVNDIPEESIDDIASDYVDLFEMELFSED